MTGYEQPIKHGTEGGYQAHRRRGQHPCDACKQAEARACAARRRKRPANADADQKMVGLMLQRRADAREQIRAINRRDAEVRR